MLFEWDESKRKQNIAKHGVDFALVEEMDWANALRLADERHAYNEVRYFAIGYIGERLYVCIYTDRNDKRRIISLRKANKREEQLYEEETEAFDE